MKIKVFLLPNLHIVVILQKKWCHFFLAMKLYKKIIYLDSRENLGLVCKNPDLGVIFFFWTTSRGLLPRLARYRVMMMLKMMIIFMIMMMMMMIKMMKMKMILKTRNWSE